MTYQQWDQSNGTLSTGRKRDRMQMENVMRDTEAQTRCAQQLTSKRLRTETPPSEGGSDDTDVLETQRHHRSEHQIAPLSTQGGPSYSGAISSPAEAEAEARRRDHYRSSSLWSSIEGDTDMKEDVNSSPIYLSRSITDNTSNLFRLRVSTSTGHPHPYALGVPSSSRFKLEDDYFDLIQDI